jgi:hypothetical protein
MPESAVGGTGAVMLGVGCSLSSFSVIVEVDAERENGLRVPRCVSLSSAEECQRAAAWSLRFGQVFDAMEEKGNSLRKGRTFCQFPRHGCCSPFRSLVVQLLVDARRGSVEDVGVAKS